jgi:hypothetical protein
MEEREGWKEWKDGLPFLPFLPQIMLDDHSELVSL